MARKRRRGPDDPDSVVPAIYEGAEALSAMLARAGSPLPAEEVAERFAAAQAAGESRGEVISALFPREPSFASPGEARRLYGNLFGLWNRIQAGLGPAGGIPEASPPPPSPPERGLLAPGPLPADFVEQMWRYLATAPGREARRLRDRFQGGQPDLAAWLEAVPLPETGGLAASDLVFETWAMFDQGFDDRLGAVAWKEMQALEAEPPPIESEQPALGAYVAEQLDNLADEDQGFGAAERAQVERVVAAVAAALGRAVKE
jgi:hypothetical protein